MVWNYLELKKYASVIYVLEKLNILFKAEFFTLISQRYDWMDVIPGVKSVKSNFIIYL